MNININKKWRGHIVGFLSLIVLSISFFGVLSFFEGIIYPTIKYSLFVIFSYGIVFFGLVNRKSISRNVFGWANFIGLISAVLSTLIFLYFPIEILFGVWIIGIYKVSSEYDDELDEST